jgi:hypothetical protein
MSEGQEAFPYLSMRSRMPIPTPIFPNLNDLRSHCRGGGDGTPTRDKIKENIFNSAIITEGLTILIIQSNTLETCISSS